LVPRFVWRSKYDLETEVGESTAGFDQRFLQSILRKDPSLHDSLNVPETEGGSYRLQEAVNLLAIHGASLALLGRVAEATQHGCAPRFHRSCGPSRAGKCNLERIAICSTSSGDNQSLGSSSPVHTGQWPRRKGFLLLLLVPADWPPLSLSR